MSPFTFTKDHSFNFFTIYREFPLRTITFPALYDTVTYTTCKHNQFFFLMLLWRKYFWQCENDSLNEVQLSHWIVIWWWYFDVTSTLLCFLHHTEDILYLSITNIENGNKIKLFVWLHKLCDWKMYLTSNVVQQHERIFWLA